MEQANQKLNWVGELTNLHLWSCFPPYEIIFFNCAWQVPYSIYYISGPYEITLMYTLPSLCNFRKNNSRVDLLIFFLSLFLSGVRVLLLCVVWDQNLDFTHTKLLSCHLAIILGRLWETVLEASHDGSWHHYYIPRDLGIFTWETGTYSPLLKCPSEIWVVIFFLLLVFCGFRCLGIDHGMCQNWF